MTIFSASNSLGYYSVQQLDELFLKLDETYPANNPTPQEEIKKRVLITYYGKNGSNIVGYIPVIGTVQAILLKTPLFIMLDSKMKKDLKAAPERAGYIKEVQKFHHYEIARTVLEGLSLGALLIPADIIATVARNNEAKKKVL